MPPLSRVCDAYVLQSYYSEQGFDDCVVAWMGDTGNSLEVNASYTEDVYLSEALGVGRPGHGVSHAR
ncbi:hypothetical protein [Stigmatella aurantiaca]|uniref:Uncharacterized protein n=1 Tax=Stigmatella aurantiaca (strain DW4/3-1) TaxID=378806 RepID=Q090Y2_STIAD|nr:hypothetical protein [Stigmatella aurantiaca]EAU66295.1 hypothetical protein STIAU_2554 [Stigmatella aurantiaca DW4/3-1]